MPFIQFQFRRGTGAEWQSANTVLAPGELGLDTTTQRFKIGDGSTAWNDLVYSPVADGPEGAIQFNQSNGIAGSSNLVYTDGANLSIAGDLLPQANITYSIGNANLRWANLFLAGNTIDLGGSQIKSDVEGAIVLVPPVTETNPNPTALVINTTGSIVPVETVDGVPNANAVTEAVSNTDSTFGNVFVTGNLTANQATVSIGNILINGDTISSVDDTIYIDPASPGNTGLVIIEGNLQVTGNVTYISSNVVTINDKFINLANNAANSSEANGGGIGVGPVGAEYAKLSFDNASTSWNTNIPLSVTGNVTANYFIGNGSQLTGIDTSQIQNGTSNVKTLQNSNVAISVAGTSNVLVASSTDIVIKGNVLPDANVTYNLGSATQAWHSLYISGNTLYIADESMAVNSATGVWSFTSDGGQITLGADSIFANSVSANYILGNGALLSGIVTSAGNVNFANIANVAYNISGSNVSGAVANATYADTANVAYNVSGSNVSGAVANATYADTANVAYNVSGSNVSGAVANATYADTANIATVAYSVSGSNVSGAVANATYAVSAGSADSATTAGTVTTNAQPNITSVGTLTALTVSGNVSGNYILGNGSQLTGLPEQYGNANVAAYLPTYTGNLAANNITITGVSTGNAAGLSAVTGANVSGTVANATYADTANIAYSVSGSNVSGTVANATYAVSAGSADSATTAGTVTTNAQPNITSVGTLTSLTVTGNISGDYILGNGSQLTGLPEQYGNANVAAYLPTYTGNLTANNITLTGVYTGNAAALTNLPGANVLGTVANATNADTANVAYSVSGSNVSGTVANATFATSAASATTAGTVTTNAQPNITSVGSLSSLTVSGNTTAANVAAGNIALTGTVAAASGSFSGNVAMGGFEITNLASPTTANSAATKQYVDAVAEGLHIHASCNAATPANLATITGGTVTYDNGSDGVGATLTTTGTYGNIDGVDITTVGSRILVKNEANAAHNGIYVYSNATVLTRATDTDTAEEMAGGDFTFVTGGTLYDNTGWVQTEPVLVIGTDPVIYVQFSGAGTYTAGTGLTLTGTEFSVNATQTQITEVGNLVALTVTGNIAANYISATQEVLADRFEGNGWQLTSINAANISGSVANANFAVYSDTVAASSQPNITSVGNLVDLTVTGNISGNYILGNGSQLTGIISGNAFGNIVVANANTVTADSASANLTLRAGNAMSIDTDPANNAVIIAQINFSQNFGFVTGNVDQEDDLGLVTLTANQAGDLGTVTVDGYVTPGVFILPTHSVNNLPNPAPAAQVIYVSDESGGAVMAFSDGTNWRRCTDRAIVT